MDKQQKFYTALKDLFIGVELEGEGGYVNLMNIKSAYFDKIWRKLEEDINAEFEGEKDFLFDHLNTFFENYFSDGGAIFFSSTPIYKNIYAKVYSDREDTSLFWKTQNLYYVKSEADYKSVKGMALRDNDEFKFDFDASGLQRKKANEKKELQFLFTGFDNKAAKTLKFKVRYKEQPKYDGLKKLLDMKDTEKVKEYLMENYSRIDNQNITVIENDLVLRRLNFKSKTTDTVKADFIIKEREDKLFSVEIEAAVTDSEQIVKYLKKEYYEYIKEDEINQAFRVYKRQSEIDYFIHKDARSFLREQFKLFVYQYLTEDFDTVFDEKKLDLIRRTKRIAYKTIDYIAGFEDELKRIWLKPKFVRRSNYVVTLDRIAEKDGIALIEEILEHNGFGEQVKEWKELGIISEDFDEKIIFTNSLNGKGLNDKFKHLPIDTRYFKDLEIEILGLFDDLDNELDGWLIHSENYQALNTILGKFKEKVQTVYIDPPFNTGKDFDYVDRFQNSTWLSLMEDRINIGCAILKKDGSYWLHLDDNANVYGKELIRNKFSQISEIIFDTNATKDVEDDLFAYKSFGDNFQLKHQTLYYCRNDNYFFRKLWKPNRRTTKLNIGWLDLIASPKNTSPKKITDFKYLIEKWNNSKLDLIEIKVDEKIFPVGDIWNDIFSFTQSEMRVSESFSFTSSQKPENLLRRIIQSSTSENELVLDYFLGIGTTTAVAHKLKRKWIGIEMGDHFDEYYESGEENKLGVKGRMKWVLFGDKNISLPNSERRPHLSKDINWQGGGFFKYYELEQYEDTLSNACYRPLPEKIEKIDFRINEKLANKGLKIDYDKEKAYFSFEEIYDDIDIIETISNITGWQIKKVSGDKATYFDELTRSKKEVDLNNLTVDEYPFLKLLIWW